MSTSSKGLNKRCRFHAYVSTTVYDKSWKETTEQFVLHLNEQFRQLDEATPLEEHLPQSVRLTLLQTAVRSIPELRIVETMEEYMPLTQPPKFKRPLHVKSLIPWQPNGKFKSHGFKSQTYCKIYNMLNEDTKKELDKYNQEKKSEIKCTHPRMAKLHEQEAEEVDDGPEPALWQSVLPHTTIAVS